MKWSHQTEFFVSLCCSLHFTIMLKLFKWTSKTIQAIRATSWGWGAAGKCGSGWTILQAAGGGQWAPGSLSPACSASHLCRQQWSESSPGTGLREMKGMPVVALPQARLPHHAMQPSHGPPTPSKPVYLGCKRPPSPESIGTGPQQPGHTVCCHPLTPFPH